MNENDADPIHWVDERYTTGGTGPEGQPDTVDESASIADSSDEPEAAAPAVEPVKKAAPRKSTAKS